MLGQRLSEWAARAPQLEEDVALLNIALDLLGAARTLLTRAGELEGGGRDEDDLAFLRDEPDFTCALLCEAENGDFGRTMARQLLVSAYQLPLWQALTASADQLLPGSPARRSRRPPTTSTTRGSWVVRLGDGTEESHRRVQQAWTTSGRTPSSCSSATTLTARLVERGVAADPDLLRPSGRRPSRRSSPRRRSRCRRRPGARPAGAAAVT